MLLQSSVLRWVCTYEDAPCSRESHSGCASVPWRLLELASRPPMASSTKTFGTGPFGISDLPAVPTTFRRVKLISGVEN